MQWCRQYPLLPFHNHFFHFRKYLSMPFPLTLCVCNLETLGQRVFRFWLFHELLKAKLIENDWDIDYCCYVHLRNPLCNCLHAKLQACLLATAYICVHKSCWLRSGEVPPSWLAECWRKQYIAIIKLSSLVTSPLIKVVFVTNCH